jgi:4-amino-4-deoxy-L-arabinose transferase-like glycosyltransferase
LAAPPVILLAVFLAVAVFVDPLRDALTEDDSWFYAWTAQRTIADGVFRLHSYATASMPIQVFWAAALSKVFGDSLITLRLSTLLLSCAGSFAFYGLLRDLGLSGRRALGLALVYLCNPYGLVFSFSFMTDVQFTSWLLMRLFLYGRACAPPTLARCSPGRSRPPPRSARASSA